MAANTGFSPKSDKYVKGDQVTISAALPSCYMRLQKLYVYFSLAFVVYLVTACKSESTFGKTHTHTHTHTLLVTIRCPLC